METDRTTMHAMRVQYLFYFNLFTDFVISRTGSAEKKEAGSHTVVEKDKDSTD